MCHSSPDLPKLVKQMLLQLKSEFLFCFVLFCFSFFLFPFVVVLLFLFCSSDSQPETKHVASSSTKDMEIVEVAVGSSSLEIQPAFEMIGGSSGVSLG